MWLTSQCSAVRSQSAVLAVSPAFVETDYGCNDCAKINGVFSFKLLRLGRSRTYNTY